MIYINYKFSSFGNETIDSAETPDEANRLLKNYQTTDKFGDYWLSNKPCKNFKQKN